MPKNNLVNVGGCCDDCGPSGDCGSPSPFTAAGARVPLPDRGPKFSPFRPRSPYSGVMMSAPVPSGGGGVNPLEGLIGTGSPITDDMHRAFGELGAPHSDVGDSFWLDEARRRAAEGAVPLDPGAPPIPEMPETDYSWTAEYEDSDQSVPNQLSIRNCVHRAVAAQHRCRSAAATWYYSNPSAPNRDLRYAAMNLLCDARYQYQKRECVAQEEINALSVEIYGVG